jgi:hypothetical protein
MDHGEGPAAATKLGVVRRRFGWFALLIALFGSLLPGLPKEIIKLIETHTFVDAVLEIAKGLDGQGLALCILSVASYFMLQRFPPKHGILAYGIYALVFLVLGLTLRPPLEHGDARGAAVPQQQTAAPAPIVHSESPPTAPPAAETVTKRAGVYIDAADSTLRQELEFALAKKGIASADARNSAVAVLRGNYQVTKRFTAGYQMRLVVTLLRPDGAVLGTWENRPELGPMANNQPDTINNTLHKFIAISTPNINDILLEKLKTTSPD